jgi:hypothetical protein
MIKPSWAFLKDFIPKIVGRLIIVAIHGPSSLKKHEISLLKI